MSPRVKSLKNAPEIPLSSSGQQRRALCDALGWQRPSERPQVPRGPSGTLGDTFCALCAGVGSVGSHRSQSHRWVFVSPGVSGARG